MIASTAWDSGLGYLWVGLTDIYEDEKIRYWSSGEEFDPTGAAWPVGDLDGIVIGDECAIVYGSDGRLDDTPCDGSYYAMCVISTSVC